MSMKILMNIKKEKDVNKIVVAAISHNKYKDVLLNNKCIRHQWIKFKIKTID